MPKLRKYLLVALAPLTLSSCKGLEEAFTAHTNIVARAGDQELTVNRLADLMGNSRAPVRKEVASALTNAWIDYQLLAHAAAKGDSLGDLKAIDSSMWAAYSNIRANLFYQEISKQWQEPDAGAAAQKYNSGEILAASHILLKFPNGMTPEQRDSIQERAKALRAQVTAANFAQMARQHSADGSAQQGGNLGFFLKGMMVPAFEQTVVSLKQGDISQPVETQFGYHIIRRPTLAEVQAGLLAAAKQQFVQMAEQEYTTKLEKDGKLELKDGMQATVRAVASNPEAHRKDKTVLATSKAGKFTAARLVQWLETFPPQQQIHQRVIAAPDSALPEFVKNFARNDLVLWQADSAKIQVPEQDKARIRGAFAMARDGALQQLGLTQAALAGGNKSEPREHLAASRVESYMDNMIADKVDFVDITPAVRAVLREKYDYKINQAGLERAVQAGSKIRAKADSGRTANQPPSAVPMPAGPAGAEQMPPQAQ